MAGLPEGTVLRQFRALFGSGTVAGLTDGQLLERFLTGGREDAEVAFSALLARHGPMVLGVCRRALRDPRDAEDAFQATFLVLVRKGRTVRVDDSLGRWLYGVSRKVAGRARAVAARRREFEGDAIGDRAVIAASPTDGRELASVLDEELGRLAEPFRSAIVLCDLGGLSHEDAARDLRCPVGTVKSRLARGRERLRGRLARRGYTPSAVMVGAEASAPAALLEATVGAATRYAASGGTLPAGAVSAAAIALAEGAIRAMTMTKIQMAGASALLLFTLAGSGAMVAAQQRDGDEPAGGPQSKGVAAPSPVSSVVEDPQLAARVTVDLRERPYEEVAKHLMEQSGMNIMLDPKAMKDAGLMPSSPSSLRVKNLPLRDALTSWLRGTGLGWKRSQDVILVSTDPSARLSSIHQDDVRKLDRQVTVAASDLPFWVVRDDFTQQTDLKIVLDSAATAATGVTLDSLVNFHCKEIKAKDALKFLLQPLQLDWRYAEGVVVITTPREPERLRLEALPQVRAARQELAKILEDPNHFASNEAANEYAELIVAIDRIDKILEDSPAVARAKIASEEKRQAGPPTPRESVKVTKGPSGKVPMGPYVVEAPDIIVVEVFQALPGRPITGDRLVRPDGQISLGFYGSVKVAGLTLNEIKEKIILHLRDFLSDESLGMQGLDERTGKLKAIPASQSSRVFVDVTSYNSKVYYVQGAVAQPGRFPVTGNDTVLDAICYAGGLISILPSTSEIVARVIRPSPPGSKEPNQIFEVDLRAIQEEGDSRTNYQLLPGDRLIVYPHSVRKPPPLSDQKIGDEPKAEARMREMEQKLDLILKRLDGAGKP